MIYLDYDATTSTDGRVVDVMIPIFTEYGNPSSTHDLGADAADMVDDARYSVSILIDANMSDAIFTSEATEANNMAIARLVANSDVDTRILFGATEHNSAIGSCMRMAMLGSESE